MNVTDLVRDLQRRGVTFVADGDRLHLEGPDDVLTDAEIDMIRQHKAELIRELHTDRLIASIWGDADYITVDINQYGDWLQQHGLEHVGWDVPANWPHGDAWPVLRVKVQRNVQGTKETQ